MKRLPPSSVPDARAERVIARVFAATAAETGQAFIEAFAATLRVELAADFVLVAATDHLLATAPALDAGDALADFAIAPSAAAYADIATPLGFTPAAHATHAILGPDGKPAGTVTVLYAAPHDAAFDAPVLAALAPRVAAELLRSGADGEQVLMQERFLTLTERGSDVVVHLRNGVIEWVSDNVAAATGLTAEDIQGQPMYGFIHPDDLANGAAIAQQQGRVRTRFRVRGSDERWIWFESVGFRTTSGAVPTSVHLLRDINEQVAEEEVRRETEERFRTLVEHASDIIVQVRSGIIEWISDNAAESIGYTLEMMRGRAVPEFIHRDDLAGVASLRSAEGQVQVRFRFRCLDGTWRWFEAAGIRRSAAESPTSILLMRDIDARVAAEETIREMETRFRILTEESDEVLIELTDGKLTYAGPNMSKLSGLTHQDMFGQPFGALVHPDDLPGLAQYAAPEFTGRFQATFRIRIADGSWQYREASGYRRIVDGVPTTLVLLRDISARMASDAALRASEAQFRTLNESLGVGVFQTDAVGRCVYTNGAWRKIAGLTVDEALGEGWASAIHPDDSSSVFAEWSAAVADNRDFFMEFRFRRPDGEVSWVHSRATALRDEAGAVAGFVGNVEDITTKRAATEALRASEELHRTVFASMADGIIVHDRHGVISTCNEAAERILDIQRLDVVGTTHTAGPWRAVREDGSPLLHEDHPGAVTLRTGEPCEALLVGLVRDGLDTTWLSLNSQPLRSAVSGELDGVVVSFTDVTERRNAEENLRIHSNELEFLNHVLEESEITLNEKTEELARALESEREHARRDALTGTLNHGAITQMLENLASEPDAVFALAMVDVDGMKAVNDTYGHQVGDLILRATTDAISAQGATVGRYGGDEFLVVLPETSRAAAEAYQHGALRNLALARITDPASGASVSVVASVGIAMYPGDAASVKALVELADAAMYDQKRQRKESHATPLSNARGLGDDRAAQMIGELVPLLTSPAPLADKLRLVSHRLSIGTGYDAVNIDVFDAANDAQAAHSSFAKTSDDVLDAWSREQEQLSSSPAGTHPIAEIISRTQRPVLIEHIAADTRLTETQRTLLSAVGIQSGISVPMLWDGGVVGIISVGSKQPAAFTANDATFLMTVATQVTAIARMSSMVEELQGVSQRMVQARAETVMMLAASAEAHDRTTGEHLRNVRELTQAIALEMGYSTENAEELGVAASLHDIGKVAVAESVLSQAGALDGEQWKIMRQHTVAGAEFLSKHTGFFVASIVARHHHERWDGAGYPDGLAGDAIPEAAAIVSVADSFDAMTSDRPYRAARSMEDAIAELVAGRGTQWSPRVVDALLRLQRGDVDEHHDHIAA